MFEAFNEILADPASRAEIVGAVIETLILIVPAAAYYVSIPT